MNTAEQERLRVELLVDPLVLCPGPDLSPIKPTYRESIEASGLPYGPETDQHLATGFSKIEPGTRAVDVPIWQVRRVLLKSYGSYGKISLIAAQTPFYYGLSSLAVETLKDKVRPKAMAAKPKASRWRSAPKPAPKIIAPRVPGASETELVRNMMCRNLMGILSDPQVVLKSEDYELLHANLSGLVAQTLISEAEFQQIDALMMGGDVMRAYNMNITDKPDTAALSLDVAWALRG